MLLFLLVFNRCYLSCFGILIFFLLLLITSSALCDRLQTHLTLTLPGVEQSGSLGMIKCKMISNHTHHSGSSHDVKNKKKWLFQMFDYSQTVSMLTVQWKPELNEIIHLRGCKINQPSYNSISYWKQTRTKNPFI